MVSTQSKNMSQNGSFPTCRGEKKYLSCRHLDTYQLVNNPISFTNFPPFSTTSSCTWLRCSWGLDNYPTLEAQIPVPSMGIFFYMNGWFCHGKSGATHVTNQSCSISPGFQCLICAKQEHESTMSLFHFFSEFMDHISGWWFQPIWTILVKMNHFPR